LIFVTADRIVSVTSAFAALLNPMWLSLICMKNRSPFFIVSAPSRDELGTPPLSVHATPVPAHAMHFRKPRLSTSFSFASIVVSLKKGFRYLP
jgi:hypothetical protein